ncbi:MAG: PRC-barrel domain-containing protein [Proteobacteria bacterium]|nr:PRC-barrel domain-containing protein [Pseudomonadota bacterium]
MTITKTALLSAASALVLLSAMPTQAAGNKGAPGQSGHTSYTKSQIYAQNITPAMDAGKLVGADVVNATGETIGQVDEIVTQQGKPHLILSVGKFLGIGGRQVAIDLDKAQVRPQPGSAGQTQVMVSMSKAQLRALPKYDAKAAPKTGPMTK